MEYAGIVGEDAETPRCSGDASRGRRGEVHGAGDLEKERARVSDGVE